MQKQFQLKNTLPIFLVYNPHFDIKVEFTFFATKKYFLVDIIYTFQKKKWVHSQEKKKTLPLISIFCNIWITNSKREFNFFYVNWYSLYQTKPKLADLHTWQVAVSKFWILATQSDLKYPKFVYFTMPLCCHF